MVEQIGTEHDVIKGLPSYYAWFSLFPAPTQLIEGFPVNPGDKIEAIVAFKGRDDCGNNIFRLTIKNCTKKVKFSTVQHTLPGNPAHLSSAEWIVEAPAIVVNSCLGILPLANFNTIPFSNCEATINGRTGPINDKHWTFDAITMITVNPIISKAIPSPLGNSCFCKRKGSCFSLNWQASGPFPFDLLCPSAP